MTYAGRVWNTLDEDEKRLLLVWTYPKRSDALLNLESKLTWDGLLPSTQRDLMERNWSQILDRNVRPDWL